MRPVFICLSILAISASIAHANAKPVKLAILGIEAVDEGDVASQEKTASVAKSFTDALRARAALLQSKGYSIPPNSNRELTEVKILSNCLDESVGCMTAVGKELGADKVLYGKLDKGKGNYTLTIKLLNVTSKSIEKTKSVTISAADSTNDAVVRERANTIFSDATGQEITTGTLVVKANVESGSVLVGGERKGELVGGVAKIDDLPEGSILVAVQADGYKPVEQEVTIVSGKEAHADLTLEAAGPVIEEPSGETPKPSTNTWKIVGWSAAGLAAGGAAFAIYSGLKVWDLEDQASQNVDDRDLTGEACSSDKLSFNKKVCDDGDKWATRTTIAWVATGIVGGAGVLVLIFKGYADGGSSETSAQAPKRYAIDPYFGPGGAGLNATIRF